GDVGIFKFKGGVDYKKYEFDTTEIRRSNGTSTNIEPTVPAALVAIPRSQYGQIVNFNGLNTLIPNTRTAANVLSLYDQAAFGGAFHRGPEPALGNNRGVEEKDSGAFVQADFETQLFSLPFRGNIGVRYVKTEQSAEGFTYVSGAPLAISTDRSYT